MYAYHSTNDDFDNDDLCPSWLYRNFWLELVRIRIKDGWTPLGGVSYAVKPSMAGIEHINQGR